MVATRWGEPSELEYVDVPDPAPGAGQVLIEIRAIGCNFPDILMVQGKYQVKPPLRSARPRGLRRRARGRPRRGPRAARRARLREPRVGRLRERRRDRRAVHPSGRMPFDTRRRSASSTKRGTVRSSGARPPARASGSSSTARPAASGSPRSRSARRSARASSPPPGPRRSSRSRGSRRRRPIDYSTEDWVERVKAVTGGEVRTSSTIRSAATSSTARPSASPSRAGILMIGFAGGRIPISPSTASCSRTSAWSASTGGTTGARLPPSSRNGWTRCSSSTPTVASAP